MANIIIGIGGTGGKVVRSLRNKIRQSRGADADTNRYLCMDTMSYGYYLMEIYDRMDFGELLKTDTSVDDNENDVTNMVMELTDKEDLAIQKEEYVCLKGFSTEWINRLYNNPLDFNGNYYWLRMSDLKANYGVSDRVFQFKEGAGQYRQIGRIGAFKTAAEIRDRMTRIRSTIPKSDDANHVYILNSLAGGTGSGNFIDIGILAKSVFGYSDERFDSATINLFMLLDGAFKSISSYDDIDRSVASYSAIRELRRFQEHPLAGTGYRFQYENMDPIFLQSQTLFDNVTMLDFDDVSDDSDRRQTVYPTMSDMVDILTAPGTGALVNQRMVNKNKDVRSAQARGDENHSYSNAEEHEWDKDVFQPYYSTFNTVRLIYPWRAYLRKASSEAVKAFINKIIPDNELKQIDTKSIETAFNMLSSSSLNGVTASMLGSAEAGSFHISDNPDAPNPVFQYFERNDGQKASYINQSEKDMINMLGADAAAYYFPFENVINKTLANKDPNLINETFKKINTIRDEHFGITDLTAFTNPNLSLNTDGVACKKFRLAVDTAMEIGEEELYNYIKSQLQGKADNMIGCLTALRALRNIFLDGMLSISRERYDETMKVRESVYNHATMIKNDYMQMTRKNKEIPLQYVEAEQRLCTVSRRALAAYAQVSFLERYRKITDKWIDEVERVIGDVNSKVDTSMMSVCNTVIQNVQSELVNWANSKTVMLGKDNVGSNNDTTMGGFEHYMAKDWLTSFFDITNAEWQIDKKQKLSLQYNDKAIGERGEGFQKLYTMAFDNKVNFYKSWSIYDYLYEYACDKNIAKVQAVASDFASRVAGLDSVLKVTESKAYETLYFKVTGDVSGNEGGRVFSESFDTKFSDLGMGAVVDIADANGKYELGFVKFETGLTEGTVEKIRTSRRHYMSDISKRNRTLPLSHITPEEQFAAVREQYMFSLQTQDTRKYIPSALNVMFANERLIELFINLFMSCFIFVPDNAMAGGGISNCYYMFYNKQDIINALKKGKSSIKEFTEAVRNDLMKHYGYLFMLNLETLPAQDGSISQRGSAGADIFTALARFVQRFENADNNSPGNRAFPISMNDALELLVYFKDYWNRIENGDANYTAIEKFSTRLRQLSQNDILKDEKIWDSNLRDDIDKIEKFQKASKFVVKNGPLRTVYADFFEHLAIFTEAYYKSVRTSSGFNGDWL